MHEIKADLWTVDADLRVITTNGFVKSDGSAVMGRGCAREAVSRYPLQMPYKLGELLQGVGNYPFLLYPDLITLPVKHVWWEEASVELIKQSVKKLVVLVTIYGFQNVVMPRPGCGNGGLAWENQVKPVIVDMLNDRFTVVDYA